MSSPAVQPKTLPTGRSLPRPVRRHGRSKPRRKLAWKRLDVRSRHCFLALIFLVAQGIFFFSSLFQVQSIQIAGLETLKASQVKQQSGLKAGTLLWMAPPTRVAERIAELQNVQRASVQYVLPGRVRITVEERQPAYQVASNTPRPVWYAVDREGVVLRRIKGTNNDLPRFKIEQRVEVGQHLHPALMATCAEACDRFEGQFPAAVWYYTLDQRGNLSLRTFNRQYPVDVQLGSLENLDQKIEILKALTNSVLQKELVTAIDLRFPAPVVRLLHPPKTTEAMPTP